MVMSERIVHCGMSYIILVGKVGGGEWRIVLCGMYYNFG